MRASALFSRRGRWRGLDLDDWLEAEREIPLAEGEVVLSESDQRIDIFDFGGPGRAGTHHLEPLSGECPGAMDEIGKWCIPGCGDPESGFEPSAFAAIRRPGKSRGRVQRQARVASTTVRRK